MNDILVSVCVITYNHCNYIRQCLDAILMQQTIFPIEVIVNDDCSTDGTAEIIKEYELKYPHLFKPIYQVENQYSKGVRGMFAKFCFPKAKGKYIAMCEGDDYWTDPLKLQKQVDFLENNEDYSMCFHGAKIISTVNNHIDLRCDCIEDRDYSANELFQSWTVPTASIVYRSECLHFPIVKDEMFLNGDIKLILMVSQFGKIRGMASIMSVYRMHVGGVSYNPSIQEDRCKKYPNHYKAIKANFNNIDKTIINEYIARSYINRARIQKVSFAVFIDYCRAIYYKPKKALIKSIWRFIKHCCPLKMWTVNKS